MDNFELVEIESIEDLGIIEMDMYDIGMVDTPHTFFANDILIHNSIFYPIEPLFKKFYGDFSQYTDTEIIEKSRPLIDKVQSIVNKSYDVYAKKYHNVTTHGWKIKQELIAKAGFWSGKKDKKTGEIQGVKKRYAQWIVDKEGVPKDYMDVKGLESVRSNFPRYFRKKLANIFEKLLKGVSEGEMNLFLKSIRDEVNAITLYDIMIPTSVKNISDYKSEIIGVHEKGTPVHVKAALNYNHLLDKFQVEIPRIQDGDKIIWCYLKNNEYQITELALSRDNIVPELEAFCDRYIDRKLIFENLFINKVQSYYDCVNWGKIILNENVNKFFS